MRCRRTPRRISRTFRLRGARRQAQARAADFVNEDPYPSTYVRYPGVLTVIRHATVFDGDGRRFDNGTVVFADGVVQAVGGPELAEPRRRAGDRRHRQVRYAWHYRRPQPPRRLSIAGRRGRCPTAMKRPRRSGLKSGPSTAFGRRIPASAARWSTAASPRCRSFPGSANLFGGRSVVVKNVPGAHHAGDEVPRRALRPQDGVRRESEAGLRLEGQHAADPHGQYRAYSRRPGSRRRPTSASGTNITRNGGDMPERDLAMDTLKGVLEGKILVQNHCYRADEMANMIDMVEGVRLSRHRVPPRRRSLQDRRSAARQ